MDGSIIMNKMAKSKKNVMLLCVSKMRPIQNEVTYSYMFRETEKKTCGYMTNEGPIKSLIEQLHEENSRLDRIVMICSNDVLNERIKDNAPPRDYESNDSFKERRERTLKSNQRVIEMTHFDYLEATIQEYAEERDFVTYHSAPIEVLTVEISDFADETSVIKAVSEAAGKLGDTETEAIDLVIDFNGGPRNVAFLILELANLMKQRGVTIRDITSMDYENREKNSDAVPICSMNAVFGSMDLVSGIHEYIRYGRIHLLKEYFQTFDDVKIQMVLGILENFANNLQMCVVKDIMESKEKVKKALEDYKISSERYGTETQEAYQIMFSFVAQDILRGCKWLLEGEVPDMIQWCIKREFIQQALMLYLECVPEYLWDSKIFYPSKEEVLKYYGWQTDCVMASECEGIEIYNRKYRTKNEKYCWLVYYLKDQYENFRFEGGKIYARIGTEEENVCAETFLEEGELRQLLEEYFEIRKQCSGEEDGIDSLSDHGKLWGYQELCRRLSEAAEKLASCGEKCIKAYRSGTGHV